jgi:CheY-like chemotaxis protein
VAGARIAVIDDDGSHIELLQDVLADEEYEIVASTDLHDAHVFLKDQRPALVILDLLQAHRLVGLDALRQLKADPETRDLPVIVMSADTATLRANAHELRMFGVITVEKPYLVEEPLSLIRQVVHGAQDRASRG